MPKTKDKPLNPVDQLAADLKAWGVDVQPFRFSKGVSLLLVKSRRTGYMVWVALHIDDKPWPRELVEQMACTNYGAMIGYDLGEIKQSLKDRRFFEQEDRDRLKGLLELNPGQGWFTQKEITTWLN